MTSKPEKSQHGGKRRGAGRPPGARSRISSELIDRTLSHGEDPAEALLRIAEAAEAGDDLALAIDAWKSLLPYVYPKPKPLEVEPDLLVASAKRIVTRKEEVELDRIYEDPRLAAMFKRIEERFGTDPDMLPTSPLEEEVSAETGRQSTPTGRD